MEMIDTFTMNENQKKIALKEIRFTSKKDEKISIKRIRNTTFRENLKPRSKVEKSRKHNKREE